MDQAEKDSKLLFFIQLSSTKNCKSNKGLEPPMPGPSTKDLSSSPKIGEVLYLRCDEKSSDNCPASK